MDTLVYRPLRSKTMDIRKTLGNVEYLFIAIASRSTLARGSSTWKGPIKWSNKTAVWYLNLVQTNVLCQIEMFEIELFDRLTVCKQMTDV